MTDEQLPRVRFYDQQFLTAQDLTAEQAYHLTQRRRHLITAHTPGIVQGLELLQNDAGDLSLLPGLAIDAEGRELILPQPYPLDKQTLFDIRGSELLDLFLEYTSYSSEPPARLYEMAQVRIERADPARRDQAVFLGQIRRVRRRGATEPEYEVDPAGRPYAGVRAEALLSPSGTARLQVGRDDANPYRFELFLDPDRPRSEGNAILGIAPAVVPPPGTQDPGGAAPPAQGPRIDLRADTTIAGDLVIAEGAVEFGAGEPYNQARPWRIYHAEIPGPIGGQASGQVAQRQLRIELPATGADGVPTEFVVGHWSAERNAFEPHLTVAGDSGEVFVHGDLVVEGAVPDRALGALSVLNITDDSSAALLRYFARRSPQERFLLVGSLAENPATLPSFFEAYSQPELQENLSAKYLIFLTDQIANSTGDRQAALQALLSATLNGLAGATLADPIAAEFLPALAQQGGAELVRAVIDQLPDQVVAAVVNELPEQVLAEAVVAQPDKAVAAVVSQQPAKIAQAVLDQLPDQLLPVLAVQLREGAELRDAFVTAIKALGGQPPFAQALAEALFPPPAQPPQPAPSELEEFVLKLRDMTERNKFKNNNTKDKMIDELLNLLVPN
jgi:hypothetical protein